MGNTRQKRERVSSVCRSGPCLYRTAYSHGRQKQISQRQDILQRGLLHKIMYSGPYFYKIPLQMN